VRPKNGSRPIRGGRRPLDDRRPGPLVEVNRLSDVDLLRDLNGIVHFDAEVANGALDLGMSKQELDPAQITGPASRLAVRVPTSRQAFFKSK
jgi:hypothetical protein